MAVESQRASRSDDVGPLFRELFPGDRLIVVSNREPYEHRWGEGVGDIEVRRPAGGLTSALDPLMRAVGGVWVAWGSGEADAQAVDDHDRVRVPPDDPAFTLRRLWLDQHDINRYYLGFANQFLWPICHLRPELTRVRARYWERYRKVNRRFAEAVLDEALGSEAVVWLQDYQLAMTPHYIRERRPDLCLAHFWHIPWPPLEIFQVTPQGGSLIAGLLANDLLGFHLHSYCVNFLRCAQEILGADVDWDAFTATHGGHTCRVRAIPISIDADAFAADARAPGAEEQVRRLRERYAPPGGLLGIGVDRMDYAKGLPEKIKTLDFLLERYPELHGRFSFVQVAVPSRTAIEAYDELTRKVERMVWEVNDRFATDEWRPVHLIKQALPPERLAVLYRASDVCVVGSLADGMNLVAKEYVASRVDDDGVLLLSRFAGAADVLDGHVEVNPYDPEEYARLLRDALHMPIEERRERMVRLRGTIGSIFTWMERFFREWAAARAGVPSAPSPPGGAAAGPRPDPMSARPQ